MMLCLECSLQDYQSTLIYIHQLTVHTLYFSLIKTPKHVTKLDLILQYHACHCYIGAAREGQKITCVVMVNMRSVIGTPVSVITLHVFLNVVCDIID